MGTFIDENTKAPGFGRRGLLVCAYLLGDRRAFHFRLLGLVLSLFSRFLVAMAFSLAVLTVRLRGYALLSLNCGA